SVLAVVLQRYTASRDLVIGTPVANRSDPSVHNLIGCFVNLLPIRVVIGSGDTMADLLAKARSATLDAHEHAYVPFDRLVEHVVPDRTAGMNPLVQVMLAYQSSRWNHVCLSGLETDLLPMHDVSIRFDLE